MIRGDEATEAGKRLRPDGLDEVVALHELLGHVLPHPRQILEIPGGLLGHDQEGAAGGEGQPSRLDELFSNREVGVVGRIGQGQIPGAPLGHAALGLEGQGNVWEFVDRRGPLGALYGPGG